MKKSIVNVTFVQGLNEVRIVNFEIESEKITEIAGTLVRKIVNARANMIKYGMKIKGFSFNRKFDIVLQVNGGEKVCLNDLFFDNVDAKITYSAKNEQQFNVNSGRLCEIIYDLVFLSMTSDNKLVIDYSEVNTNLLGA